MLDPRGAVCGDAHIIVPQSVARRDGLVNFCATSARGT